MRSDPAVHQFVPALIPRDATGSHTLLLRSALRKAGWRSEIFAEATHDDLSGETLRLEDYPRHAEESDVLIYQFATSSIVADFLLEASGERRLIIDYHNVTRPELIGDWDEEAARRSSWALDQLRTLAPRASLGIAVSRFNELDLVRAGCPLTVVCPVLFDLRRLVSSKDQPLQHEPAQPPGPEWLFVGRIVPSKAQHRLVEALWAYRRVYDARTRLTLVGSAPSARYLSALRSLVSELGLRSAVRIVGDASDAELAACYRRADVFVSASRHEGFGIPVVEAMHLGVPVVALGAGALPETIGDGGLVLNNDEPLVLAAAVNRVLSDEGLRRHLVRAGRQRAGEFELDRCERLAIEAISKVAGAEGTLRGPTRVGGDGPGWS